MNKISLLILFILPLFVYSQNVTILPTGILPSSNILKLKYSELKNVSNPNIGDIIFDLTFSQLRFYNGSEWDFVYNNEQPISSSSSIKSSTDSYGIGICVDSDSSIYSLGSFTDSVFFNNDTLVTTAAQNTFIYKTSIDNELIWRDKISSTESLNTKGIQVDSLDNIYIYGSFSGTISYQTFSATTLGGDDIFIFKINKLGQLLHARRFGGTDNNSISSLKISPVNTVFFCGKFKGNMPFASINRVSSGGFDGYLAEMDSLGNQLSFIKIGGAYDENIEDFAFTVGTHLVVGGNFGSSLTIGTSNITPNPSSFGNMYLATMDFQNFTWEWALRLNSNGNFNEIKSLSTGFNGSIYVSGVFSGTFSYDLGSITSFPSSVYNGFILQTSGSLNTNWAYKFSGYTLESCEKVISDNKGNAYFILNGLSQVIYSTFFNYSSKGNGDTQIVKLSPTGNLLGRKIFSSAHEETLKDINIGKDGKTYYLGTFKNKLIVDNIKLESIEGKNSTFWGFYDNE